MSAAQIRNDLVIETRSLTKRFGRKTALNELSLPIARGGVHAIVGSNGAGKTTLFRILLGLMSPSEGSSRVLGVDSRELSPEVRGRVGLVHEEHTLPGWMTVRRLITMHRDLYPQWSDDTLDEVLGHFHVLPEQKTSQLSRGERAGLNLAMALAQKPELLILDEPTLGLDVVAKGAFLESLMFASEDDCTIVYCSHQMDEIERVAGNLIILERGELAFLSPPDEFCSRIGYWVTDFPVEPPKAEGLPGLLQARTIDGQQHFVVLDPAPDFPEQLQQLGAFGVHSVPIGFDRAVNAYLQRRHASPNASPNASPTDSAMAN